MKFRIEPKPEGNRRFRAYLETDDLCAVRAWIANPPIPVTTRMVGTNGTHHQLTTKSRHDIIVSSFREAPSDMDDRDNIPRRWMQTHEVSVVATTETEDGRRQIERWNAVGKSTK